MNNFSYFSKALDEVVDARLDDYVETLEVDKRYEFSEKYTDRHSVPPERQGHKEGKQKRTRRPLRSCNS